MFAPISVTEFQKAYATVLHVLSGNLEFAPGVVSVSSGSHAQPQAPEDLLVSRAWYMSGLVFVDPREQASFYWRIGNALPLVQDKKYRKCRGEDAFLATHRSAQCGLRGSREFTDDQEGTAHGI